MDIKNYISSGILEAYVLGELSESIKQEVERNADEYPEVYAEIRQIKEAFHIISVQSQKQAGILPDHNITYKKNFLKSQKEKKFRKINKKKSLFNKIKVTNYLATAALVLAIIASFAAADLYLKLKFTQDKVKSLQDKTKLKENKVLNDDYAADLDMESYSFLFSPNFKRIELIDFSNKIESNCWIFWNDKSQELFLQVNELPFPETGKQFQLWAIIDQTPVNAGLIPTEFHEDFIRMKRIKNATAFIITLEPEGGSEAPDYKSEIFFRSLVDY